ncbi:MAG: hypothetical protein M0P29_12260 [Sphaerochaetaceae bacterium]|nr:hypothetical protein [Sphaerochaetaceae bacterium]
MHSFVRTFLIPVHILLTLLIFISCPIYDGNVPGQNENSRVIYVDVGATGNQDGSSWISAMHDLQAGIDAAAENATDSEPWMVWVKEGTYTPQGSPHIPGSIDVRDNHFTLRSHVQVYGGFAGNESTLVSRNGGETVLSGELPMNPINKVFHILYHPAGAAITGASIHDVTFTKGNASGTDASKNQGKGGAVFLGIESSPYPNPETLYSILFDNCKFSYNVASSMGGAIYIDSVEGVLFSACLFDHNQARAGGNAVTIINSSPDTGFSNAWVRFEGCGFLGNSNVLGTTSAENSGGGGAVQIHESKAKFNFCTIMNNTSAGNGGALAIHHNESEQNQSDTTDVIITNCLIARNNTTSNGGALYIEHGGRTVVFGSTIADNEASVSSDAIYLENGYFITLFNTLIAGPAGGEQLIEVTGTETTINELIQGLTVNETEVRMNIIQGFGSASDASLIDCASTSYFVESEIVNRIDEWDYHLKQGSCAVDAGNDEASLGYYYEVDLATNPRVIGTHVDIGTFEYQGQ